MAPNLWTHIAVTRDPAGKMRIYLDGELDSEGGQPWPADLKGLRIGATNRTEMNSGFELREFRHWDHARSPEQILADLHTDYGATKTAGLIHRISGDTEGLKFQGAGRTELVTNFPHLKTAAQARADQEKLVRYLEVVKKPGNAETGKLLFAACLACHKVKGAGGILGPDLSGVGAMGDEAILQNILFPNAKMESGYYRHDILTNDGEDQRHPRRGDR